ncbi:hypothetical protein UFOVP78_22 [uncultured Caudovirales phage]|uniref:Uncharacterized protein n=1 Tax=uncultured Caudovirales phage TaxID=2100421 RepID=A0A6J5KZY7_9CAUD|nr:hypothetical protein UFOVP78_22 [uncultured Caudovirales phage]
MDDEIAAFNEAMEANRPPVLAEVVHLRTPPETALAGAPFRCLGHDRGRFFFTTAEGRQVLALNARSLHTAGELVALAPLKWWENAFPGKTGFVTAAAADSLIRASYGAGVFDPARIRGRGVWLDAGRTVVHVGNRLIVDGKDVPIPDLATSHIYEQARALPIGIAEDASDAEAKRLLILCSEAAWTNPDRDGRLLAGWIVCALVCGALRWRPHLWITSEAGGGKSWILDNIIRPTLRDLVLAVQSKTSEAGIRGELGSDGRPVLFDEAETQNDADRGRVQQILDLARQASSEDGGAIVKGTKEGGSRAYLIRSCFAMASVNLGLSQAADESRFVVLGLGSGDPEQFKELKRRHAEAFTEGFAARLFARCLRLLPTIRHNAEVLADAIARSGAGRRAGDTLGTVLAGAMSLVDGRELTPAEADRVVSERDWVRLAAAEAKPEPEWRRALARLAQHEVRLTNRNGRPETTTVGDLIGACVSGDEAISPADADAAMRRLGMRVDGGRLRIGNRSEGVAAIFSGTPWATGWLATLARAPSAERGVATRFSPAYMDRCVAIPLATITGEEGSP